LRRLDEFYDRIAMDCIAAMKRRYSISQDIWRCFLVTKQFNAAALRPKNTHDKYVIAICGGALRGISESIGNILMDADIRQFLDLTPLGPGEMPAARDRYELNQIAFRWLVYHELGHIKNGHLHLTNLAFDMAATEAAISGGNFDLNLTKHTLEMDADYIACNQTIYEWLGRPSGDARLSTLLSSTERARIYRHPLRNFSRLFQEHPAWRTLWYRSPSARGENASPCSLGLSELRDYRPI
jgi:hypothetical protein